MRKKWFFVLGITFLVLFLDQWLKIWVKTQMYLGEDVPLFGSFMQDKARLHFIENEGMAFGMKWDWEYGKLALSLFRILAVGILTWFIGTLIRQRHTYGVLLGFALILAGATGNIIDSAFYGMVFEESMRFSQEPAGWVAWGEGYAPLLHGKVVDMFHFPLTEWVWPQWMPGVGGERFVFFSPVFNIADAAITVGVVVLMLFIRSFSRVEKENQAQKEQQGNKETTLAGTIPESHPAENGTAGLND